MKKQYSIFIAILAGAGLLAACEKNTYKVSERIEVTNTALLKIGFFAGSTANPSMQLKMNGERVSPLLVYNTPFPGGGLNTSGSNHSDYLNFAPGEYTFSLTIPKVGTNEDSIKVLEQKVTLEAIKQTIFVTDSIPNITTYQVKDAVEHPTDSGRVRIKFVNLMPNLGTVDFYRNTELIAANVPFKGVVEYKDIFAGSAIYYVREAGTGLNLNADAKAISLTAGRIYTLFSRGYKGKTGTLAPNVSAMIVE
jgi:hypothetical protein